MNRITEKQLQLKVDLLNELTGSPMETYKKTKTGYKACIGNYHLSYAYGGVSLHRLQNSGGGVEDIFSCGHTTKRDLYNRVSAYVQGIINTKEEK